MRTMVQFFYVRRRKVQHYINTVFYCASASVVSQLMLTVYDSSLPAKQTIITMPSAPCCLRTYSK